MRPGPFVTLPQAGIFRSETKSAQVALQLIKVLLSLGIVFVFVAPIQDSGLL